MGEELSMSSIPAIAILGTNPRFQSPYAYLQGAGSDGSDGTSAGIDLRWTFLRSLGNQHLPKGDFAAPGGPFETTTGFSRADDYVRIYKSPYSNKFHASHVRLAETSSKRVLETGGSRRWHYDTHPIPEAPAVTTTLELRFTDVLLYDFVRATVNPATDPLEFLRRYTGRIEMQALGKHLLNIVVSFEPHVTDPSLTGPTAWGEAVSTRNRFTPPDLYVSCREELPANAASQSLGFTCEDIRHIRFRYVNSFPFMVDFQTYEDYILGTFMSGQIRWLSVGRFSLMLDDGQVKDALLNAPHDDVDKRWPKYNEANPATGEFTVSTKNYIDRWEQPEGLRHAVERYLELSRVDPRAVEVLTDPTTQPNEATIENSYLDSLNIVAQDFHVARMLGLGHIDNDPKTLKQPMVYLLEYVTEGALEPFGPKVNVTHYSMSMPVSWTDYRLPLPPVLRPPRYGLFHQPIENEPPHLLSDPDGYTRFEPSRWINLDREPFAWEGPLPPFFSGDPKYCFCTASAPAMYGVEYRKLGEPAFRRPEISHDDVYQDPAGIFETNGVLELEQNPVYMHRETAEGVHQYALYSVNWFSRVSPLSNVIVTDDTRFPVLRNLKPPGSFAVQLVQKEEPLIFTTSAEQAMLAAHPGPDTTLVRVTFEWDQVHNTAYQFADQVELYFRDTLPGTIQGEVAPGIDQLPNHRVRVRTAPQTIADPPHAPETRQPFLLPAEKARYIGANFVTEGRAYVIHDIEFPNPSGNNPSFIVNQVRETSMVEGLEGELITQESFAGPSAAGRPFMGIENVSRPENWDARLARTVYLEPFHEAWPVRVTGSVLNDREYTIASVALAGGQTQLTVREEVSSANTPLGALLHRRRARAIAADPGGSTITVDRNLTTAPGALTSGTVLRVYGAPGNAGSYTVTSVSVAGGNTIIGVVPPPPSAVGTGYVDFQVSSPILAADPATRRFTLAGDLTAQLAPPRIETVTEDDGTTTELVIGGLTGTATITELPDGPSPRSGVFRVIFHSLALPDHVDPSVEWYRGTVRIPEDASLFPPPGDPSFRPPQRKILNIWEIDRTGATLRLTVFDPTFDPSFDPAGAPVDPRTGYVPIATGTSVDVNAHPGYRLYLGADAAHHFGQTTILPGGGQGNRKTALAARSVDTAVPAFSPLTPPAVLLAQEIREPVPPGIPTGPLFATRPDFYGKATYTFDVDVSAPYALVFYRGTERGILDALYRQSTVAQILADVAALESPDAEFVNTRWRDLAGGVTDETHQFPQYVPGGYRFPVPDNDRYVLPHENPSVQVRPFTSGTLPGLIADAVKRAIEGSFVPMTARPLIYAQLAAGTTTSGTPPVIRNPAGELLVFGDPAFQPWPMSVRLPDGNVRFTDYALDGAGSNLYFYFGVELSNRMTRGERGPIAGPVTLVNSAPPVAPAIRDLRVRTANPVMNQRAAVLFTLNPYLESDAVVAYRIYRTNSAAAAATVRGMELVRTVDAGQDVIDDFASLDFPPYGETLHYRIVALRRFVNENGQPELAPSFPSDAREVLLIDDLVPPPPDLGYSFGEPLPGPLVELPDVTLTWSRTAWNPRYHVFKMNPRGNWVKIHTFADNTPVVTLNLNATELNTDRLPKQNAAGRTLYHRFKVVVENSSGLLSNVEKALVI
jgi:hypothetical protein